jgi:hypothetical protein
MVTEPPQVMMELTQQSAVLTGDEASSTIVGGHVLRQRPAKAVSAMTSAKGKKACDPDHVMAAIKCEQHHEYMALTGEQHQGCHDQLFLQVNNLVAENGKKCWRSCMVQRLLQRMKLQLKKV